MGGMFWEWYKDDAHCYRGFLKRRAYRQRRAPHTNTKSCVRFSKASHRIASGWNLMPLQTSSTLLWERSIGLINLLMHARARISCCEQPGRSGFYCR